MQNTNLIRSLALVSFLLLSACSAPTAQVSGKPPKKEEDTCQGSFNKKITLVQELVSAYERNPISFDAQYKGKCVTVYGGVTDMGTTLGYDITLTGVEPNYTRKCRESESDCEKGFKSFTRKVGDPDSYPKVVVSIPKSGAESVANLKVGTSNATFLGRLDGIVDGITISITDARRVYQSPYTKEFQQMEELYEREGGQKTIYYRDIKK